MQKQLLNGYLFGYPTVGIATPFHAFHLALQAHLFDIGLQNGFVTHYPYHLIYDTMLRNLHFRFYGILDFGHIATYLIGLRRDTCQQQQADEATKKFIFVVHICMISLFYSCHSCSFTVAKTA